MLKVRLLCSEDEAGEAVVVCSDELVKHVIKVTECYFLEVGLGYGLGESEVVFLL